MSLDELVLLIQRLLDRAIRRLRLGRAPLPGGRRFLIVQIDGLSQSVFEQGLAEGRLPFVRRLLTRHGYRLTPMSVGLPSSTPAFQLAAMYGVRPDIPGFHYHDKRRRDDVYFPRGGDAAWVERTQAGDRPGVLRDGGAYGCVFTGGATDNLLTFAMLKRPTGGPFDPPAVGRAAAGARAPVRPLRALRPRPGAVHPLPAPLRRAAHRGDPARLLRPGARTRSGGARRARAAGGAGARGISHA